MDPFNKFSDERIEELIKKANLGKLLTKKVDDPKKKKDKRKKEEIEY